MLKALGIEWPKKADISVPIGGSSYVLSTETQQYLVKEADSKRYIKSKDSVLIIQEAHESIEGQINLFHGLEIFFRDNPSLIDKTIFLAEGYPANQLVSIQPLIKAEPNPSDELIHEVLGTFLITGYMAYEWKHQQEIPIVGTEEEWLYFMSRDFDSMQRRKPDANLGTLSLRSGKKVNLTPELMAELSYLLRNKKMAEVLFDKKKYFDNPLLFVGAAHMYSVNEEVMAGIRYLAQLGVMGPFHEYYQLVEKEAAHKGLAEYLQDAKIGFTCLSPKTDWKKPDGADRYLKLFQSQQQGEDNNGRRDNYRQYVEELLAQRNTNSGVTTKPSPEAAAEYVKAIQGEVIFEAKQDVKKGGWFKIPTEIVRKKLGKDTIWDKRIAPRGGNYEKLRGANLASNFPVVDHYDAEAKTVTSLKTLDLRTEFYNDIDGIEYTVGRDINELSEFTGAHWTLKGKPILIERGRHFQDRYLEIAIPTGSATQKQREKLEQLQEFAQSVDVILDIVEAP